MRLVASVCVCVYHVCGQKMAVWGFTASKSPVSVIVRSSSITAKKRVHYARRFVQVKNSEAFY